MAVLVTAEVPGQTQEGYEQMIAALSPALKQAKGFIAQGAGPMGRWVARLRDLGITGGRIMASER